MKHTPPYYRANMTGNGQGLIIDEETGSNIAIVYDEDDTDEIVHAVNMHQSFINTCQDVLKFLERTNQKDTNIYRQVEVNLSQAERK